MSQRVKGWIAGLFVVWLFFVLASFFTVQKPFAAATAAAVLTHTLNLLTALWLLAVALGLGRWLLVALHLEKQPLLAQWVFAPPLGLGLLGLFSLAVGLLGGFRPWLAYLLTSGLTLLAAPQWLALRRAHRRRPATQTEPLPTSPPGRWTALFLTAMAILMLLPALLPPIDWDGLFYHLTGPKLYLQTGQIFSGFDVPHFNFPASMEMLFAWAMLLRGDVAATLLHTSFAFLLAGLVYLIAVRWLSPAAGWRAVLLLAAMPLVGTLAGWAYNDLALAFYQLAAVYWLISMSNEKLVMNNEQEGEATVTSAVHNSQFAIRYSPLILSGIFAGLAMSLKYTSFVTPLFIVAALTFYILWFTHSTLLSTAKAIAAFSLPALLTAAPWYLKNWAFTGNPVYPFLYDVFGGQYWDSFRAEWYANAGSGIGWQPDTLLALPWLLTLGIRDANYWDGRTGPLLLLFLPLILLFAFFLVRRPSFILHPSSLVIRHSYLLLLLYALAHYTVWTLGVIWSQALWQSRLLLPGLVALVPLAAWVWIRLPDFDTPRFALSRFANLAIALTLCLTLLDVTLLTLRFNPLPPLLGQESRDDYLTRRLGAHYGAMTAINRTLPADATVAFLWEPRSYYCRPDCRPDSILDEFPHLVYQYDTAEAIAQHWQAQGITHILIHQAGLEFMLNESPEKLNQQVLTELQANYLEEVVDVAGVYRLFKLTVP